jgi:hypothetical protein
MTLGVQQLQALDVIIAACASECTNTPLGNLLEGHLKVAAVNALLQSDYSVMEGANARGSGRVIALRDGKLTAVIEPRPQMPAREGSVKLKNSPDIRVWTPCRLIVELQVRTSFGSQCALFSANLADDLDRIRRRAADAFVLAADVPLYNALCGIKENNRGRKPKHAALIRNALPPLSGLLTDHKAMPPQVRGDYVCAGLRISSLYGIDRCVVAVWSAA